ncbi:MAG: lysophospholipid acyltransferase family protein [Solirubrobacteraceae bacterium]
MEGSIVDEVLSRARPPARGAARMAATVLGDIAQALDVLDLLGDASELEIDARDPDYIRATLPTIGSICRLYFRGEVSGFENIPDGPVLLVGNHSGGTLIADTFVFGHAFYHHFGADRRFHQLAHDLVFAVPGVRAMLSRYGTIPASPENMREALARDAALLVYPGGDHETYRPSWESDEIDFANRTGFVRLALELGTPIVPVVAIGGQETALFLGQGRGLARRLQLDRLLRLKVLPAQIGFPLGLTVLDLPLRVPLPAKITVRVLPPIDLKRRLGAKPEISEGYELVTETMQEALDLLSEDRTLPIVG